jgi:V/A-type H+-transporting ATPase subunit I
MIVAMDKVHVVSRSDDQDALLAALRRLGVMHLAPVDPAAAVAEEQTLAAIASLDSATRALSGIEPAGEAPDEGVCEAAKEALRIGRQSAERAARLAALHREIERLEMWGDVRLEQFEELRAAGVDMRLFSLTREDAARIEAECVAQVAELPGKRVVVAVVDRDGEFEPPEEAEPVELPRRDAPSIRAEAAEIDEANRRAGERLAALAHLVPQMEAERARLAEKAGYTAALRSGMEDGPLYAIQGWVPADEAASLAERLSAAGVTAGVQRVPPAEDEQPPTLIRYPRWARPIKGLFDMLGTNPGYREYDLSPFFMVALPIFAAMLIGDAGYGLVFLLPPLLVYRRISAAFGKPGTHMLMVMGAATFVWGVLTANFFGLSPQSFSEGSAVARAMKAAGLLWRSDPEASRMLIIQISFVLGCVHLTLAHLRRLVGMLPGQQALSELGWCIVLWAMLGVIWLLFFGGAPVGAGAIMACLGVGAALAVLFTHPARNPLKRVGIGLASSILPLLGTFSDTMSYIRLMAVGLASYYIAAAFNGLGADLAATATWLAGAPVVLFGHALNIGLAVIAIFAHGVRLNMLEFSNNAGVQWAGYAYRPFAEKHKKES